jgi:tetratricopeptide (TPR) repeat protein
LRGGFLFVKESTMRAAMALTLIVLTGSLPFAAAAQTQADRERARIQNKLGWEDMRAERWERAIKSFQAAIDIDPGFEIPYYGLGRAYMALKNFPEAIISYEKCRDLFRAQAGRQFANVQEAQRYRRDRITEIDEQIRQVQALRPSAQQADMLRQLEDQRRDIEESLTRGNDTTLASRVPAYVSLALGSAYFRAGRLTDAEREYKATIDADSRSGEAHSNLAVVYLETERFDLAFTSLQNAKKTGFKVNPELEKAIRSKAKR